MINKIIMNLLKYECNRCYHSWIPRAEKEPKICPNCKSPLWNKARKHNLGKEYRAKKAEK